MVEIWYNPAALLISHNSILEDSVPASVAVRKADVPFFVTFLFFLISGLVLCMSCVSPASAMVRIDFDQKYFIHPHLQTWDFSLIRHEDTYHIYYHTARVEEFAVTGYDTIWHSTSPDLVHWNIEGPVITTGQGSWDAEMTWAPDVFHDERNHRFGIAYTGVDESKNQRICFAFSPDLYTWTLADENPVLVPDYHDYIWDPHGEWSNFRDPYIYWENRQWNILVTAKKRLDGPTGVLYHGVSDDLVNWEDVGYFFANDGNNAANVLESSNYHQWGDYHHLLFGEYGTLGTSSVKSLDVNNLSMSTRVVIDNGYAPEVDSFDPGVEIFSRLALYINPQTGINEFVIKLDTLLISPDGSEISVHRPHPLSKDFELISGISNWANPTFGDNAAFRGEAPVGVVGNGYYGSAEYFQGPLSGSGEPGDQMGNFARGELKSFPFIIEGDRMDLLVGGGNYPETCYVALMDASTDTVIFSETGGGDPLMTPRQWDLSGLVGRQAYIKILDNETGGLGFINVDEIVESASTSAVLENPASHLILVNHGAFPNPFNPATNIRFSLTENRDVQVRIYDLRGLEIWNSGLVFGNAGLNNVAWRGVDASGQSVPTGVYLYSIENRGLSLGSGKLSLVK